MSSTDSSDGSRGHKTLAIRLDLDLHARLSVIAQLQSTSLVEEIRNAIEAHVVAKASDPELAAKAEAARQAIEADASTRRGALASLFGSADDSGEKVPPKARTGGRKASEGASATS